MGFATGVKCSMCGIGQTFWEKPPALPNGWLFDPDDDAILCGEVCLANKRELKHQARVAACPSRLDDLEKRIIALENAQRGKHE